MDAERPGVPIRLDHFRFSGQVLLPILDVALAELRLEVRCEPDAVGRVHVDHLHLARQVLAAREARHHLERVAEDHPVRPVHVVTVELDRFRVVLLRVGEEVPVDVLPCQHPQDGLGGNPFVHVQGHRIDLEPRSLPLAAPLQPRLVALQRRGQDACLLPGKRTLSSGCQELLQPVGRRRFGRRAQHRRQVRVVPVVNRLLLFDEALCFEPRQGNVLPGRRILERRDGLAARTFRGRWSLLPARHGSIPGLGACGPYRISDRVRAAFRPQPPDRPAPMHPAASGILAVSEGCRSCLPGRADRQ